jgi:hypothetical protein
LNKLFKAAKPVLPDFFSLERRDFLPAVIGAGVSLVMLKTGFLSFFFLVPLGFVAYSCHYRIAWLAFLFAFLGNVVLTVAYTSGRAIPVEVIGWDIFYYTAMTFIFIWIIAAPASFQEKMSEPLRLIAGSVLGSLLFSFLLFRNMDSQVFLEYANYFVNSLISAYRSARVDVVENAMLEMLTPEYVMEKIMAFMLRGGSLISCVLLFFVCCQLSLILARLFFRITGKDIQKTISREARLKGINTLSVFHVNPRVIWLFSSSLLLVIFTRVVKFEIPEIILWNILIICSILYLAQGLGIMQFFLARPSFSPFLRLLIGIAFVFVLFSPFINAILLGGLVLLGIAENWLPLRVSKQSGPPSTPEAGGGEN